MYIFCPFIIFDIKFRGYTVHINNHMDILFRISGMLDSMKGNYSKMSSTVAGDILNQIQASIRRKVILRLIKKNYI